MLKPGQFSIHDAVQWILTQHTREYRRACIAHWRGLYGDAYADEIERKVNEQWKGKKS